MGRIKEKLKSLTPSGRRAKAAIDRLNWDQKKKKNPADGASALFEEFHGVPSEEVLEFNSKFHIHENLAGLGRLTELVFITPGAKQKQVTMTEEDIGQNVWLCASEDAKSLYIIGEVDVDLDELGYREDVDVKDAVELGRLINVVYQTKKAMHNLKLFDYDHELGKREAWQKRDGVGPDMNKEIAPCPILVYRPREDRLEVVGGQYVVIDVGISN